jgi:ABC-2 type transport system ATP-binding protein
MANKGTTILVTTHYMDEAELCQRVGFINQGRLVAIGTPDELKQTHMHGQVLEIDTPEPDRAVRLLKEAQLQRSLPFDEVALYGAQIHVVVPNADEFLAPVRKMLESKEIVVSNIVWIMPTLEDVFISTVRVPGEQDKLDNGTKN